jgi:hypothetical protein
MITKRKTPYDYLMDDFREFAREVVFYKRKSFEFYFPKKDLSINNQELYQRAIAAKTLGYEIVIIPNDDGLYFQYQKKRPTELPWRVK